mmetsp:Transcript_41491/g.54607  ORF Transcript_41491/g.54607 Transcript_41491/m.54607 type:complete len:400 (-) Transcript_41491:233-1432(-)|eukprot:CAMPEP_0185568662 /NCGR_PEP_ID=MMETSP0434-20130131/1551_1 /TAXON_ID=626734 ORGANISM="Favella taraikaensis, Strain Fe Narragansett Bay" /NCGR_SAMPLE_ID=MMETSP0434 /ASSEMBLY_ACC=CAM_ASM_000379 /LENGTH=399 /DNA_ID=CAMNT_0028183245 /DNA_START=24 /DNA_END=1223 /DNA_ORIENTATION=+
MRILSAFALIAAQVWALFEGEGIETLTSDNWAEKVDGDEENAWVITFYADWCPYCKTFSDEFSAAITDPELADKKIKFGALDVMANRDLTKKYGIKRSPTVKIFGKDKETPEDYVGQRKTADIVSHVSEFCTTNEFVVAAPEPKEPEYTYNIDAIIKAISDAHKKRVAAASVELADAVKVLEGELGEDLKKVKEDFQKRLEQLASDRKAGLQAAYDAVQQKITDKKSEHALSIANLDDEAITVVESIIAKHKENIELAEYIETLDKDWFNITWDYTTRRPIDAAAQDTGYAYGAVESAGYAAGPIDPVVAPTLAGGLPSAVGPAVGLYGAQAPYGAQQGYGVQQQRGAYSQQPAGGYGRGYGAQRGYGAAAGGYGASAQARGGYGARAGYQGGYQGGYY